MKLCIICVILKRNICWKGYHIKEVGQNFLRQKTQKPHRNDGQILLKNLEPSLQQKNIKNKYKNW